MKIARQDTSHVTVDEIECGEVFFYENEYFIKIRPVERTIAICLEDGLPYSEQYFRDDKVTRCPNAALLPMYVEQEV